MRFGGQSTYIQLNVAYDAYAQAVEQLGHTLQDSFADLTNSAGNPNGSQLFAFQARVYPQGKLPCPPDIYGNLVTNASCAVTPPLAPAVDGRSYRYKDWAGYVQDSFRVVPRLTLNYGVRYEHYGVQHNNKPQLDSNFYFGSGSSIAETVRSGGVQIADKSSVGQFWAPRWGTVAPRIGIAIDPAGDGKNSIRAGYGISYERNFGNVTYNASFNPPASAVVSSNCGAGSATCTTVVTNNDLGPLGLSGRASYLGPVELRMPDPNIKTAQTQFARSKSLIQPRTR
jgi:TonB dependent receptor